MEDLVVGKWVVPAAEIDEIFDTSGGPGGQHANRTRSAVRLRFPVSGSSLPDDAKRLIEDRLGAVVEATSSESRSQFRNRAIARRRLADKLHAALEEPTERTPTRPTRASRNRRLHKKRARGELKRQRRRPGIED